MPDTTMSGAAATAGSSIEDVVYPRNVRLTPDDDAVVIIDQTQLPGRLVYEELHTPEAMYDAIKRLKVRGAPAIGIAAGYCAYVLARHIAARTPAPTTDEFLSELERQAAYLNSSRPTAVNLSWALRRMLGVAKTNAAASAPLARIVELLGREARAIHEEDVRMCTAISEYGLTLLHPGDGVLTHCNAGPLATSKYGTGQGPLFLAQERGYDLHVFADETRPLLQGARLTSYELSRAGVDVTLICDNMASIVMRQGWVQACMVGCDRVAMNGDAANKIGTSGVAILAAHYGIPFYVLGPTSTIDRACPTGDDITIELRDPAEIREMWYAEPMAPADVKTYNPSFDVTDHSLITAIVTEKGICRPPYTESLGALFE